MFLWVRTRLDLSPIFTLPEGMVVPISVAPDSSLATSDIAYRFYQRVASVFSRFAFGTYVAHPT